MMAKRTAIAQPVQFQTRADDGNLYMSLPARGAWIEISQNSSDHAWSVVAPRTGSGD